MAKTIQPETKPAEMSRAEKAAKIAATLRKVAPRITDVRVDLDAQTCEITVPKPTEHDPRDPFAQRAYYAETGMKKVERATIDYLLAGELRELAGGELSVTVTVAP